VSFVNATTLRCVPQAYETGGDYSFQITALGVLGGLSHDVFSYPPAKIYNNTIHLEDGPLSTAIVGDFTNGELIFFYGENFGKFPFMTLSSIT